MKWFPYLVLIRPANIVTAISDVLAGIAIVGVLSLSFTLASLLDVVLLCLSTSALYAGGIVFNDIFDLETDNIERPERIIPSGKISLLNAKIYGIALFILGLVCAIAVSLHSFLIALGIILFAVGYDKYFKHMTVGGPLTMGICRGLNLLLGMSILATEISDKWMIAILPIIFIAAITLTSRDEVKANNQKSIALAIVLDLVVAGMVFFFMWKGVFKSIHAFPFIILWLGINLWAKITAIAKNESQYVQRAVKLGVLSLIPLNASYAAGSSIWIIGMLLLSLLPLSLLLSKHFAVT